MFQARFILAVLIILGSALAACSGGLGSGTSAPGGLLPSGPLSGIAPSPSPTPDSASAIVTYGDSTQFQPLPELQGYGGAIALEVPSPRPSGFQAIPIGVTLSVREPADTPDLNLATPGKKGTKRSQRARELIYITLLPTRDITLSSYPRIAVDVPRGIVTTYRVDEINLALFDAGEKDKTFILAAEPHDSASPPPLPTAGPTAPPPPTAIPLSAASAGASPGASPTAAVPGFAPTTAPSPLPSGAKPSPSPSPTLPPQRILFASTPHALKMVANVPVVFAVYAMPMETPSPTPSGLSPAPSSSGSPKPSGSPLPEGSPAASGSPVATGSPLPQGSSPAAASPVASGT